MREAWLAERATLPFTTSWALRAPDLALKSNEQLLAIVDPSSICEAIGLSQSVAARTGPADREHGHDHSSHLGIGASSGHG